MDFVAIGKVFARLNAADIFVFGGETYVKVLIAFAVETFATNDVGFPHYKRGCYFLLWEWLRFVTYDRLAYLKFLHVNLIKRGDFTAAPG